MSSLKDGAKERAPCIDYQAKTATLSTSFGEILIEALPKGLLIKGIPKDQASENYTPKEADTILSLLIDYTLVGDKMASSVHLYRKELKILARLMDFKKGCTCQDNSLLGDIQSILVMDTNNIMESISHQLFPVDKEIHKAIRIFIMKTVRLANTLV